MKADTLLFQTVGCICGALIIGAALRPEIGWCDTVASLYSAEGGVEFQQANPYSKSWIQAKTGQNFAPGDRIRTLKSSRAAVRFKSGYLVRMAEKTTMTFDASSSQDKEENVGLLDGILYFFSRKPEKSPRVSTNHLSASVRGTEFVVEAKPNSTRVSVIDGLVIAKNDTGETSAGRGEQVLAEKGKTLALSKIVDLPGIVQWAVSFPSLLSASDIPELQNSSDGKWQGNVRHAMQDEERSQLELAISDLGDESKDSSCGWYVYRAALAFRTGQIDYAEACLNRARDMSANLSEEDRTVFETTFLSLKAMATMLSGRLAEADGLVEKAKATSPHSFTAWIADSYLNQAAGKISDATYSANQALKLNSSSPLAQTRVAELLLASANEKEALNIISEVLQNNADNSYAQALKGFALLSQGNAKDSATSFETAIALDPSVGNYRLGLGLAKIKMGQLDTGRRYLEEAANLEPNYSLVRSYLGKAYFEEEKEELASNELDRAIILDKEDPTPFLYRAHLNLSKHRPVEALSDIENSIDLNDNRAVFRSRFLLDQDLGARTANLGRIYQTLGFSELARLSAMKTLAKDYGNYSAHFLLADSYKDKYLTDRARVTESIIGRLLVPMTFNANSVQLAGPSALNEYSTMFDRPDERSSVAMSGNTQTETITGQLSHSRSSEEVGFNLGYSGSNREGYRANDFERFHQGFFQGQYQTDLQNTVLWDGAVGWESKGDIDSNFDPHAEDPDYNSELKSYLARIGYRHNFGHGIQLIAQALVNEGDTDTEDEHNSLRLRLLEVLEKGKPVSNRPYMLDITTSENLDREDMLTRGDLQLIVNSDIASHVLGISGKYQDIDANEQGVVTDPGSAQSMAFTRNRSLSSSAALTQDSLHLFSYNTWHLADWLDFDTGVVYTRTSLGPNIDSIPYVDHTISRDSLDPKLGLIASFDTATTIRASYTSLFDSTARGGLGQLEPTFVGGFNQLYDAIPGTAQDIFALGLDQKIGSSSYLGGDLLYRKLSLKLPVFDGGFSFDRATGELKDKIFENIDAGGAEISRTDFYYYQVLRRDLVLALEYAWEYFNDESVLADTSTNRVQTALRYFHPSGVFAQISPVWRYQERGGDVDPKTTRNFVMLDMGLGYEFAARRGRVQFDLLNVTDYNFDYSLINNEQQIFPRIGGLLSARYNF